MEAKLIDRKRERDEPTEDTSTTPGWLVDYVKADFPITFYPLLEQEKDAENFNALINDWQGFCFAHPPHAEAQLWCEKAARQAEQGVFSVLLLPAVFNSVYWREVVYRKATEIRVFACPVKMPSKKKQIVAQMCLVVFAGPSLHHQHAQEGELAYPPIFPVEPNGWESHYYKRARNQARFTTKR